MLTNRQKKILSMLSDGCYVTSSYIASKLNVSDRTIRNEIKSIERLLDESIVKINVRPKYGISIEIMNIEKFHQLLGNQRINHFLPSTPKQRVQFIMEYLLAHDDFVKIEDIADLLYMSTSSISADIKIVRDELKKNNLELIQRPKYGLKVEGSEFDRRLCISQYLANRFDEEEMLRFDKKQDLERIASEIEVIFEISSFIMADFAFNNLVMHIYIAIQRVKSGKYVPFDEVKLSALKSEKEFLLARQITERIENLYQIEFPETECGYIAIHLLGKKTITTNEISNIIIDEEMYAVVGNMLQIIDEELNLELSSDFDLRLSLAMHLVPMKSRLEFDLNMRNPLLQQIKEHYILAYMAATSACVAIKEMYHKEVSEDEIGYIALHINLALERKKENIEKKNIIMVCSTGRGSAELLEHQYRMKFGRYINKLITTNAMNIVKMDFRDIDFVISTVPINEPLPVPIIQVQMFLEDIDEINVRQQLNRTGDLSIEKYFDKRLFLINVPAKNKEEVIDYMTMRIRQLRKIPRNFKELVMLREKKAVTEFGNLIAIPHPYKVCTDETFVCVAILKKPIIWNKKQVQLVFMLSVEKNRKRNLQKFYEITSKMLMSKQYVKLVLHDKKYSTLMDIFRTIENQNK